MHTARSAGVLQGTRVPSLAPHEATICIHSGLDSANFMCGYASSAPSTGPNSFIDCLQPAARSVRARGQRRHDACHLLITCQVPAAGRCSHLLKQLAAPGAPFRVWARPSAQLSVS